MHVTVSRRFLAKLDAARDALSHSHPGAKNEVILEAGLDLLLARHRERRGIGASRRRTAGRAAPGRIRAAVKREVWERDGGCCRWPLDGGGICGSTLRLEFDHVVPQGPRRLLGGRELPTALPVSQPVDGAARSTATTSWTGSRGRSRGSRNRPPPGASAPPPERRDHPRRRNFAITRFSPDAREGHGHLGVRPHAVAGAHQPLAQAGVRHHVTPGERRAPRLRALVEGVVARLGPSSGRRRTR